MNEESLFVAALDQPTESGRQAFLDEACAGDVAMRERVERLLLAHDKTLGILDQSDIPPGGPPHLDRACDRFEAALRAGGEPELETFLDGVPDALQPRL